MVETIYRIEGFAGSEANSWTWQVRAFRDQSEADAFCELLNSALEPVQAMDWGPEKKAAFEKAREDILALAPNEDIRENGGGYNISYSVEPFELH